MVPRGMERTRSEAAAARVVGALAFCIGSLVACGSSTEAPIPFRDEPDAAAAPQAWGASPCAECIERACADERARCTTEPSCARNMECVGRCPGMPDGRLDESCAERCPPAAGTSAEHARSELARCRTVGAGALCTACGGTRYRSPTLNQVCPQTTPNPPSSYNGCVERKCCDSRRRCNDDREGCYAFLTCKTDCAGKRSCEDECYRSFDSVFTVYEAHSSCALTHCFDTLSGPPQPCARCARVECGDEHMACNNDHDCVLLERCQSSCLSLECFQSCAKQFPAAVQLSAAVYLCARDRCPACL